LIGEAHITLTHARRVDEHELLVGEAVEDAAQIGRVLGNVHRRTQDTREIAELLSSANPIGVGADQAQLVDAVPQHEPCRDLGDARRLAHARRPDDREHAAVVGHVPGHERESLAEASHDDSHGFLIARRGRHVVGELGRQRGVDAELRELAQQPRADRRLAIQIAPCEARELRLQQAAQVLDLERHRRVCRRISGRRRRRSLSEDWRWGRNRRSSRHRRSVVRARQPPRDLLVVHELRGAGLVGFRVSCAAEQAVVVVDGRDDLDAVRQLATRKHDGIGP
jgi:hypothetical protein